MEFSQFLDEPGQRRLVLFGEVDVRLFRGFFLSLEADSSLIRDQIYLPGRGATDPGDPGPAAAARHQLRMGSGDRLHLYVRLDLQQRGELALRRIQRRLHPRLLTTAGRPDAPARAGGGGGGGGGLQRKPVVRDRDAPRAWSLPGRRVRPSSSSGCFRRGVSGHLDALGSVQGRCWPAGHRARPGDCLLDAGTCPGADMVRALPQPGRRPTPPRRAAYCGSASAISSGTRPPPTVSAMYCRPFTW